MSVPGQQDSNYVPVRRPALEWVRLDGEVVVYDPRAKALHRLNSSAAAVWTACDGTTSVEGVVRAVQVAYEAPPEVIARDVRNVIRRLARLGLLQGPPERGAAVPRG